HTWSGGKPFCALDYPIRCVELNALSKGAKKFYMQITVVATGFDTVKKETKKDAAKAAFAPADDDASDNSADVESKDDLLEDMWDFIQRKRNDNN
ncbi:MAG: hypothetical protein IJD10_03900, partial [Clostridia bacterium]|nr:hypothetical protein [Clostridia bacterium]